MKKVTIAFLLLLATVISCKKSGSDDNSNPSEPYMNLSAGNAWTYETVNNITSTTSTNVVTSSNRDTTVNSKSYHVFINSNGAVNDYYNITGNEYYTFRNLVAFGSTSVESIYLKDNVSIGTNWSQIITIAPFSGVPTTIPLTITYSIAEKGISLTVNGKVFTNVIHVTMLVSSSALPSGSLTTDIHNYYAPKYGLIESKYKITTTLLTGSNVDQTTTLKSTNF